MTGRRGAGGVSVEWGVVDCGGIAPSTEWPAPGSDGTTWTGRTVGTRLVFAAVERRTLGAALGAVGASAAAGIAVAQTCRRRRWARGRDVAASRAIMSPIDVHPDDLMRERVRSSLNRVPDIGDWEVGNELTDSMRRLNEPVGIHRKSWEYSVCITGLERLGVVSSQATALGVGAGYERPLFHFANTCARMVATDLYDNPDHEGTPAMVTDPGRFAPFPYAEDRLEVRAMPGDRLEFPDDTFDFAFCLSSIEHFGTRETQRRSLDEMARVVRPSGILCIITELILTDHHDDEYFRWEEIEDMFLRHPRLELVGGEPDLSISQSLVDFPVAPSETARVNASPHIVLRRDEMLWTSFSMFLRVCD